MVSLKEFVEKENIELGGFEKFPVGDTFINLKEVQAEKEESPFKDKSGNLKAQYKLIFPDGRVLVCPIGVMADIKKLAAEYSEVRVTRTGLTKDNTSYTVIGTKK